MRTPSLLLAILAALSLSSAHGIEITFNADAGYSTTGGRFSNGTLSGQKQNNTSHAWRGPGNKDADVLRVVADGGNGQIIKAHATPTAQLPTYTFDTDATDLGGHFSPTGSTLSFHFYVRYDAEPKTPTNSMLRFNIGVTSAPAVTFEFLTDGRIFFNNSTNAKNTVRTKGGAVFKAREGEWIAVSGTINYGTETWTCIVNGVPQSERDVTNLGFRNAGRTDQTVAIAIRDMASGTENFVPYSIDDITLQVTD